MLQHTVNKNCLPHLSASIVNSFREEKEIKVFRSREATTYKSISTSSFWGLLSTCRFKDVLWILLQCTKTDYSVETLKNKVTRLIMDLIFIFNECCFEHEFSVVLTYNIGKPNSVLVFCILKKSCLTMDSFLFLLHVHVYMSLFIQKWTGVFGSATRWHLICLKSCLKNIHTKIHHVYFI